jgi:hypothetical protein
VNLRFVSPAPKWDGGHVDRERLRADDEKSSLLGNGVKKEAHDKYPRDCLDRYGNSG